MSISVFIPKIVIPIFKSHEITKKLDEILQFLCELKKVNPKLR